MEYTSRQSQAAATGDVSQPSHPGGYASFEYIGKTALSVTGNYSGRSYRFHRPGDIQAIDNRDATGMIGIAVLKRLH